MRKYNHKTHRLQFMKFMKNGNFLLKTKHIQIHILLKWHDPIKSNGYETVNIIGTNTYREFHNHSIDYQLATTYYNALHTYSLRFKFAAFVMYVFKATDIVSRNAKDSYKILGNATIFPCQFFTLSFKKLVALQLIQNRSISFLN